MTVAVAPCPSCLQWLPRACTAALLRRVRRQELLGHTRRPEVPRAAVHHIRRVVRIRAARVIERNRKLTLYFLRVPSIRTWCWCLRWGIWGSGRSDQSFFWPTRTSFFPASLPFFRRTGKTGWSKSPVFLCPHVQVEQPRTAANELSHALKLCPLINIGDRSRKIAFF
jgi:hypothetical protein